MPASVSPVSGNLGNKETAAVTPYVVSAQSGTTVTQIVERINGIVTNTVNNPASLSRTLTAPQATWDALAYFATHTATVTVTDSGGGQTVATYTFVKRLANNASLLEAAKANADARARISIKRDALAAQVGLSAGSTFDAISAQLASGNAFKKFASGTATTDSSLKITVTGLSFTPKYIIWVEPAFKRFGFYNTDDGQPNYLAWSVSDANNGALVASKTGVISANGFSVVASSDSGRSVTWWAFS